MPDMSPNQEIPPGFKLLYTLQYHEQKINLIAWSPDGQMLASAFKAEPIRLWDVKTGKLLRLLEGNFNHSIAWSPNGKVLAAGGVYRLLLWNMETGELLYKLRTPATRSIKSIAWSPDGKMLAFGSDDGSINFWNAESRQILQTLTGHTRDVNSLAWSPDGRMLASGSDDGGVRLWLVRPGKLIWMFEGHLGAVNCVVWSPNGEVFASASNDNTIRFWDPTTKSTSDIPRTYIPTGEDLRNDEVGQEGILKGHLGPVISITFSSDGRLLASKSLDGTIRIWRSDTQKMVTFLNEPSLPYRSYTGLAFHPRVPILATIDEQQAAIRVWELNLVALLSEVPVVYIRYTNAKVVLVGDSGVGKTGLGLVLTNQSFTPSESTHGRHIWPFFSQRVESDSDGDSQSWEMREILLWDLAGQPDYRLIHQLHLNEVAVALIVFDARSETDPFAGVHYWSYALRQAQYMQGNSVLPMKKFLVAARMDRGGRSVSQARIDSLLNQLGFDGYFETSAKEEKGITPLAKAIRREIAWDMLPKVKSTDLFQRIKDFIVIEKDVGRRLSTVDNLYHMFMKTESASVEKEEWLAQFETSLGLVESLGLIQRFSFGNLVLLQPELLDIYASALVNAVKNEPDGMGSISEERVLIGDFPVPEEERLKDKQQERLLLLAMVEDLLRHEIALRESTDDGQYLVFPSQSTRESLDMLGLGKKSLSFDFAGPVLNIYATLIVRLSHNGMFKLQELGNNAATYIVRSGGSCGIYLHNTGEGRGELTLFFDKVTGEDVRFYFKEYVETHLKRRALPDSIKKRSIFECSKCGALVTDQIIQLRLARGFDWLNCSVCNEYISLVDREKRLVTPPLSVIQEMDRIADMQRERDIARSILQGKIATSDFDVFLCHNHEDKPEVIKIGEQLKENGILPWLDEWNLPPFVRWQDELQTVITQMKAAAVFIGPSGLGPWEDIEMNAFLAEFAQRKIRVGLVLLPGCTEEPKVPLFMKSFHRVDFRKRIPDPMEQLIWGITRIRPSLHQVSVNGI